MRYGSPGEHEHGGSNCHQGDIRANQPFVSLLQSMLLKSYMYVTCVGADCCVYSEVFTMYMYMNMYMYVRLVSKVQFIY